MGEHVHQFLKKIEENINKLTYILDGRNVYEVLHTCIDVRELLKKVVPLN